MADSPGCVALSGLLLWFLAWVLSWASACLIASVRGPSRRDVFFLTTGGGSRVGGAWARTWLASASVFPSAPGSVALKQAVTTTRSITS
ncbi:MAG: hypothetical protein Q8S27_15475 [Hoeflea sp.]|uniref:hypothetical protein n=1 Tax=Hoeflea sp. TaxID=1940281 RepID=UPI00273086D1|nr:hypothetical protein [Hoeflea sp.]MDP3525976.1 hypothetical protein [Hoeflea sp.]